MTSNELEIFKQSILDEVRVMMQTTGQVTQYIGARYVPLFADPLEWSETKEYEPLTIVLHQGNSFTSRQFVPKGIDISDDSFWANTGNYNAQIEQYRQEVATFDGRITTNAQAIASEITRAKAAEQTLAANLNSNYAKDCAFIIGNSYTTGYDTHVQPNSIAGIADKIFKKAFVRGSSAAGFLPYTGHTTTFANLLQYLINNNPDELDNITHVIFNSAIGDTAAYLEINNFDTFKKQYTAALIEITDLISTKLPNVRYIGVCMMESMQFSNRTFNSNIETNKQLLNTYFMMKGLTEKIKGVTWMGFPGWNLMGSFAMTNNDNTHPNSTGYFYLTNEWINALNGTLEYLCATKKIELDLSEIWNNVKGTVFINSYPDHSHVRVELEVTDGTLKTNSPKTVAITNNAILVSERTFRLVNGVNTWVRFDTNGNIKIDLSGVTLNNSISYEFDTEYLTYPLSVYY